MRTLLVGLGGIGSTYSSYAISDNAVVTHAEAIHRCAGVELGGGVDYDSQARRRFNEYYQRPAFTTLDAALSVVDPELLVVASPTETHSQVIASCINSRALKVILCEKPFTGSASQAKVLTNLSKEKGIPIFVNYQRRADPVLQHVGRQISEGYLGTGIKGTVWYTKGLVHNGSHMVDLLIEWLGPLSAVSQIRSGVHTNQGKGEFDAVLTFTKGEVVARCLSNSSYDENSLELYGSKSYICYESSAGTVSLGKARGSNIWNHETVLHKNSTVLRVETVVPQLRVYEELVRGFSGREVFLSTANETTQMLRALEEISNKGAR